MSVAVLEAPRLGWRCRPSSTGAPARPVRAPMATTIKETTDADLVLRARRGDGEAFRSLVERYEQRAYWVARGMLNNDEDARDAAQDAFIRVHRSLERFDVNLRFYTWLYQIVVNLCIDQLRKRKKRRGVSLDAVGDIEGRGADPCSLEGGELKARVALVLDELPPKYKAVMVLSDLEGIGAKEIATITSTTHATVRWRHHRARKLFREAWERNYGKGSHAL
jgi:RNA polymerase sigma-70 factor (ECF subfamily)